MTRDATAAAGFTGFTGLRVGHWTDPAAATGCTVVLFPDRSVASAEVRGGAPATREVELLAPDRTVDRIDALVLTGGSAFGLAAADGVVRWCEAEGAGFATPAGPVPIVVALGLFDLTVGDPSVRPDAAAGRAACRSASDGPVATGRVGAGAGATVGDGVPGGERRPGGLVAAEACVGALRVATVVAVNAFGAPGGADAAATALPAEAVRPGWGASGTNTTIGLVVTNARLDKAGCLVVAQGAQDGLSRALFPAHTRFDGDAFVAASVGPRADAVEAAVDAVRALAVHVVTRAVTTLAR